MRLITAVLSAWLCAVAPLSAQDMAVMPVVGVMRINGVANNEPFATMVRKEAAARGYVEGRNLRIEYRCADCEGQCFPQMAEREQPAEACVADADRCAERGCLQPLF